MIKNKVSALSQLRSKIPGLSKSEKKIALWILENTDKLSKLSMAEIAAECEVSDTTVLRLSRSSGFQGYTDMRFSIVQDVVQPTQLVHDKILESDTLQSLIRKVFLSNIQSLHDTLEMLNLEDFEKVINTIASAQKIIIAGVGASSFISQSAYQQFRRLDLPCIAPLSTHMQIIEASLLTDKDLAIAVSYTGMTRDPAIFLETARKQGAKTVCLTGNASSPITNHADLTLVSIAHETRSDSISSRTAQLAIFDAIYVVLSMKNLSKTLQKERHITNALLPKTY